MAQPWSENMSKEADEGMADPPAGEEESVEVQEPDISLESILILP